MKSILRFVAPFILLGVASICIFHAEGFQQQQTTSSLRPTDSTTMFPMIDLEESKLLSRELEWAEQAMEAFQRKNNGHTHFVHRSAQCMYIQMNGKKHPRKY